MQVVRVLEMNLGFSIVIDHHRLLTALSLLLILPIKIPYMGNIFFNVFLI